MPARNGGKSRSRILRSRLFPAVVFVVLTAVILVLSLSLYLLFFEVLPRNDVKISSYYSYESSQILGEPHIWFLVNLTNKGVVRHGFIVTCEVIFDSRPNEVFSQKHWTHLGPKTQDWRQIAVNAPEDIVNSSYSAFCHVSPSPFYWGKWEGLIVPAVVAWTVGLAAVLTSIVRSSRRTQ